MTVQRSIPAGASKFVDPNSDDKEVGALFDLVMRKKNICSLELHTLTFTGQGGVGFDRSARITIPDLLRTTRTFGRPN